MLAIWGIWSFRIEQLTLLIVVESPVSMYHYFFVQQWFVITKNMILRTDIMDDPDGTEFTRRYEIHDLEAYFTDSTNIGTCLHIGQRLEPWFSPKDNGHYVFLFSRISNLHLPSRTDLTYAQ